ncbi:hypothetical protein HKX54_11580 [Sulfitobacter sp. M57]|uniref:hypothetical protein n=1 Tax=unclassified Sulfitobacter TaxID=196795 RepID=UPI0023E0B3FF|nr:MULTISPECIES: hypothetical protein [unclassified Sulfitobacter]MDF3415098.1 hypothetical protein [Sulfitobacter sp. KE5]MDF3422579.1 hypothetical protein [Sulfitobacter sp. KE43]MDF3433644.1 hypothetical protein [Sulfitobacter sp. KE42]MDF3459284.1 hypothetical protein [Sulfitobacter sp. S74]MDF3463183.1 hypothetical protein [Sulfitobacter sp. Ks18]
MNCLVKCACALGLTVSGAALAQETDLGGRIAVELNAAQTTDTACTLTFMITNGLKAQVDRVVYETVLFDTKGQVNRLTLFDFGTLPVARPRVRQFSVPELTCDQLGRVLFNGANTCDGADLDKGDCARGLDLSTRTQIEVIG